MKVKHIGLEYQGHLVAVQIIRHVDRELYLGRHDYSNYYGNITKSSYTRLICMINKYSKGAGYIAKVVYRIGTEKDE